MTSYIKRHRGLSAVSRQLSVLALCSMLYALCPAQTIVPHRDIQVVDSLNRGKPTTAPVTVIKKGYTLISKEDGRFYEQHLGRYITDSLGISGGGGSIDTVYDYTALRAYTDTSHVIKVNKPGIDGLFVEISAGSDDGGVVIVGDDDRIWMRLHDPALGYNAQWWLATPDDGIDDRDSIQQALDFVDSIGGGIVTLPPGVYNVSDNSYREGIYLGDHTTLLGQGSVSEIRYTGHATLSSTAIQNRRSSGQYSDYQQRTGNIDIHIEGIKLSFTERDDFKNIGINLSGVDWCSINDTWVDSCGGYSVLVGRTNDTDTIGNWSENVIIQNLKITNMMDVGLEVWGCQNVTARDLAISGRGTDTGYGIGVNVWNGAQNILISNGSIEKDTNDYDAVNRYMVAFNIDGFALGDTITGARKTQNVTFEGINARTDIGFRINRINDVVPIHRVDSVLIRDCNFLGYDTIRNASDIRHCRTLVIEGCTFDRFARHLQFSSTSSTSFQNSVSDLTIRGCSFTWGDGIDFYGITDFNIYDNRFYYIFDQAPITVRGGRYGLIKHNYFLDIGVASDQWCITLNKLTASITRDTRQVEITYNTACDDRTSKMTDDLVTMYDATDSIVIRNNTLQCADTDADPYNNLGTGTSITGDVVGSNWTDSGSLLYPTENDNIHIPSTLSGSTGVLNVIGRIDQRYPSSSLYNIMIGKDAGNGSMSGDNNIGIGNGAVQNTSTGLGNIGIGLEALQTNTTGVGNTGLGYRALTTNNGSSNVAIGNDALLNNSSGATNTAMGTSALLSNTTASDNVGIGFRAGRYNQAGGSNVWIGSAAGGNGDSGQEQNVMIGSAAGYNSTGDANIYIGYHAGENATGHEKLYIDNSNTASPLILGDFSANTLMTNGKLGFTNSGSAASSIIGRDGSNYLTPVLLDGLTLFDNVLKVEGTGSADYYTTDSTFCFIDLGDTTCVLLDSIFFTDTTICYIYIGDTTCVDVSATGVNVYNSDGVVTGPRTVNTLQGNFFRFLRDEGGTTSEVIKIESAPSINSLTLGLNDAGVSSPVVSLRNVAGGGNVFMEFENPAANFSVGVDRSTGLFNISETSLIHSTGAHFMRFSAAGDSTIVPRDIQFDAGVLDADGDYGTSGQVLSTTGTLTNWITPASGAVKISDLLAATATNTIDNVGYQQEWQWSGIGAGTGLKLSSTSTAAVSNTQKLFEVSATGTNATASQTTHAGYFSNTHDGTGAQNYALYAVESGTASSAAPGAAIYGTGQFRGVHGSVTSTASLGDATVCGVVGQNTGATGVLGLTTTGTPLMARMTAGGSGISGMLLLQKFQSGSASTLNGASIDILVETSAASADSCLSIVTRWMDKTYGSRTSQSILKGVSAGGVMTDILYLEGDKRVRFNGRAEETQGADVASAAGAIALGYDGNTFEITGTAAITRISNVGWQNGSTITLIFTSTASLTTGTASSGTDIGLKLGGAANFNATADDAITLKLCEIGGTQLWREISRSAN